MQPQLNSVRRAADHVDQRLTAEMFFCHLRKRHELVKRTAWGFGMDRAHRSLVTGRHGHEHVERFCTTDLANDDSGSAQTQGGSNQFAIRNRSDTLDVIRPAVQRDRVGMRPEQGQLGVSSWL